MGKKFDHCGDSEATDYNAKAIKSSKGRTSGVDERATDYSIPGKKVTPPAATRKG